MSEVDDERVEELEILAAHQARTLEELNEVIVRQGSEIERLGRILEALVKRFQAVEERVQQDTPVDKPPHW